MHMVHSFLQKLKWNGCQLSSKGCIYYTFTTFESKVIHGFASLCNVSSEKKTSEKPVNTGYTDI